MQRRNVDLPEPEGPSRQATSRGWTSSEMPLRTSSRPKRLWTASALSMGGLTLRRSPRDGPGSRLRRRRCSGVIEALRDDPRPKWRSM